MIVKTDGSFAALLITSPLQLEPHLYRLLDQEPLVRREGLGAGHHPGRQEPGHVLHVTCHELHCVTCHVSRVTRVSRLPTCSCRPPACTARTRPRWRSRCPPPPSAGSLSWYDYYHVVMPHCLPPLNCVSHSPFWPSATTSLLVGIV